MANVHSYYTSNDLCGRDRRADIKMTTAFTVAILVVGTLKHLSVYPYIYISCYTEVGLISALCRLLLINVMSSSPICDLLLRAAISWLDCLSSVTDWEGMV